uniref:Globin domain-containing protein n=1 Tax=Ciona savignyi TaxID=51511 RepID=H2YFM6_CIOSA
MSLTTEEVITLRTTWAEISKLGNATVGLAVLHRLFNDCPEVRPFFGSMLPPSELSDMDSLKSNPKVVDHASRVALSINNIIQLLENTDELVSYLSFLGKVHGERSIPAKHFSDMGPVLLAVISAVLREDLEGVVMQTWAKAYGAIEAGITKEL